MRRPLSVISLRSLWRAVEMLAVSIVRSAKLLARMERRATVGRATIRSRSGRCWTRRLFYLMMLFFFFLSILFRSVVLLFLFPVRIRSLILVFVRIVRILFRNFLVGRTRRLFVFLRWRTTRALLFIHFRFFWRKFVGRLVMVFRPDGLFLFQRPVRRRRIVIRRTRVVIPLVYFLLFRVARNDRISLSGRFSRFFRTGMNSRLGFASRFRNSWLPLRPFRLLLLKSVLGAGRLLRPLSCLQVRRMETRSFGFESSGQFWWVPLWRPLLLLLLPPADDTCRLFGFVTVRWRPFPLSNFLQLRTDLRPENRFTGVERLVLFQLGLFSAVGRLLWPSLLIATLGRRRLGRWTVVEIIGSGSYRHDGLNGGRVVVSRTFQLFPSAGPFLLMAGRDDVLLLVIVFARVVRTRNGLSTGCWLFLMTASSRRRLGRTVRIVWEFSRWRNKFLKISSGDRWFATFHCQLLIDPAFCCRLLGRGALRNWRTTNVTVFVPNVLDRLDVWRRSDPRRLEGRVDDLRLLLFYYRLLRLDRFGWSGRRCRFEVGARRPIDGLFVEEAPDLRLGSWESDLRLLVGQKPRRRHGDVFRGERNSIATGIAAPRPAGRPALHFKSSPTVVGTDQ